MSGITREFDVVIIGGGPAGISAALWSVDLGMSAAIIEQSGQLGGQLLRIFNPIENYPGVPAENGSELARSFIRSLDRRLPEIFLNSSISSIDFSDPTLILSDQESLSAKAIIFATGVRRRRIGIPGEAQFVGRGILASGAGQREQCVGKRVLIVGGGDAALENAEILGEVAAAVFVVHRRDEFTARPEIIERACRLANVEIITNTTLEAINGDSAVRSVTIAGVAGRREIEVDNVLIRIGVEPNSGLVSGSLDLDRNGYILVDSECRTSVAAIYAVGDVANPVSPTISTAAGMGATAAKSVFNLIQKGKSL